MTAELQVGNKLTAKTKQVGGKRLDESLIMDAAGRERSGESSYL